MAAVRCTAPARGHVPGSQAQRQCPVHGDRARTSPLPVPATPIAPAPDPASEHKRTVRPDGTVIEEWPDGTVIEQWRKDDELHREDGPAQVKRYPDGTVAEWWYKNGRLHREDDPAWVERSPDGTVFEWWYRNNERHREDGPAYVEHYSDGFLAEEWYKDGELHREDGPARVERSPDGTVESEDWCLNDTEVEPWEVLGRYLLRQGMPELSAEALKQIAKDVPWQRWDELGSDHPLVALWSAVHPSAEINAG